ncbi:oligosaccharide flippase family protein [Abyssicoccus albus]|uniref:O-antigen/teichoic acid export membrane protein n=1 Tax=Abyssicoccus albus TaxID=1817405 RepID=A0A3N5BKR7_9BACL|nr:oligosaccharide flippase family protein [Abyssicoccus albus]RPF58293.1 O-antigen/teichoic acid export membrane protein [Abyssicoccus albus]
MKNKFKKDVILTILIQGLIAVSNLCILFLITRNFGTEDYGDFYLIKRMSDLFWVTLLFGLTVSVPRNIYKVKYFENILIVSLSITLISSILVVIFPNKILNFFISENSYIFQFKILIISQIIFGITNAIFRGLEKFIVFNILNVINFIISPLFAFTISDNIGEYIYNLAVVSLTINLMISLSIISIFFLKNRNFNFNLFDIKYIVLYGFKRLPGLLIASFIFTLPIFVIDNFNIDEFKGYVSQIFQFYSFILLPINTLGTLLLPKISKTVHLNNKKEYTVFKEKLIYMYITIVSMGFIMCLFIPLILNIINFNFNFSFSIIMIILGIIPLSIYNLLRNPIDAITEKPWTSYIVICSFLISIILLVFMSYLNFEKTIIISIFILSLYSLLGLFSIIVFNMINRRFLDDTSYFNRP